MASGWDAYISCIESTIISLLSSSLWKKHLPYLPSIHHNHHHLHKFFYYHYPTCASHSLALFSSPLHLRLSHLPAFSFQASSQSGLMIKHMYTLRYLTMEKNSAGLIPSFLRHGISFSWHAILATIALFNGIFLEKTKKCGTTLRGYPVAPLGWIMWEAPMVLLKRMGWHMKHFFLPILLMFGVVNGLLCL